MISSLIYSGANFCDFSRKQPLICALRVVAYERVDCIKQSYEIVVCKSLLEAQRSSG